MVWKPSRSLTCRLRVQPVSIRSPSMWSRASDVERDILDIIPSVFHEDAFFAGSAEDIDEVEKYGKSVPGGVKQTEGGGYKI